MSDLGGTAGLSTFGRLATEKQTNVWRVIFSSFLALVTSCFIPLIAAAQSEPPGPYDILDIWLRVEQLEQRCHILNYFEIQEIERGIVGATKQTPEGNATQAAIGWPNFDAELEKRMKMVDERRTDARLAVAERPCTDQDTDVVALRSSYVRRYLKALIASQQSRARQTDRAGRRRAGDQLFGFAQSLYGANYETVGQSLISELQSEGFDADVAWNVLKNPINDGLWQIRLGEKAHAYQSRQDQPGYYRAVKTDGSEEVFPAQLTHRSNPKIIDSAGYSIEINQAEGVTDDGRFVIMVSKDSSEAGSQSLQAQLLVQEVSARHGWIGVTWRESTLKFDADVETGAGCPVDFCFTFPVEASEAVRVRRADEDGFYNYELVIAAPNAFPLETKMNEYGREAYYPPSLPND